MYFLFNIKKPNIFYVWFFLKKNLNIWNNFVCLWTFCEMDNFYFVKKMLAVIFQTKL